MFTFLTKLAASTVIAFSSLFGAHQTTPLPTTIAATSTPNIVAPAAVPTVPVKPISPTLAPVPKKSNAISSQPGSTAISKTPAVPSGTLCNGTYWSSCSDGYDFVCPSSGGGATCQPSAASVSAQQQMQAQQQAQLLKQQQATLENQLAPLRLSFDRAMDAIKSDCDHADAGTRVTACKLSASKLQEILSKEIAIGLSVTDARMQLSAIQAEYYVLQTQYYDIEKAAADLNYIRGRQANVAAEMQIIASAANMLGG